MLILGFGVKREFVITPVSLWQLKESLHLLTKNLGAGEYIDGILLIVMCADSRQIEDAKKIASEELAQAQYRQLILAVPKQPVSFFDRLMQYQALVYLKKQEGSLYGESGELHEEWSIWFNDIFSQLTNDIEQLINPENRMLEYCWKGVGKADIINRRKLKDFTDEVMQDVFPHSPYIGDDKLAMDDFSRNWGYRKECRDIVFKLTKHGAAEELIKESASAPKHVINQLLMINGILSKNQAGEAVIGRPSEDQHSGAAKVWDCIDSYLKKVKKGPVSMGKMVKQLRNSPYGVKCRIMPILFAAVAHSELSLGNLSFEFSRTAKKIEKISSFENDTLEKVFISPEKYKLVYVNVSSDQNELIAGLAKVFSINLESVYLPLERVQKVGENIGAWWRGLSGYAQITENISDEAAMLRDHVFRPLAQIEPDIEKILLQDIFKEVFKIEGEAVKRQKVTQIVQPIREEFENTTEQLRNTIYSVCSSVFSDNEEEGDNGASSLSKWFHQLDEEKRNFIFHGDAGTLIAYCREGNDISESTILSIAEKITGMKTDNWSDELWLDPINEIDFTRHPQHNLLHICHL
ncbi:Uncharacterized protein dnl_12960 [Desulfonema limicola]|uniref:Uncharacterized protein n=1 Tax=Desulfonema limicola TaxID=45656 RepID=A0A975GFA3_9BACT|nr:hypothetical protein [Desulfonema limicola]QTA79047.1 Uncharacterized protein dnl_12960 [Desulfonema limicola]